MLANKSKTQFAKKLLRFLFAFRFALWISRSPRIISQNWVVIMGGLGGILNIYKCMLMHIYIWIVHLETVQSVCFEGKVQFLCIYI